MPYKVITTNAREVNLILSFCQPQEQTISPNASQQAASAVSNERP